MPDQNAAAYLRMLVEHGTNSLVLGGTRQRRRNVVKQASAAIPAPRLREFREAAPGIADELEALGKQGQNLLVIFHDAHRIAPRTMWQIRSVAQMQRNVTYIVEGGYRNRMFDMVIRYDAAFYRQLTVVDVDRSHRQRR